MTKNLGRIGGYIAGVGLVVGGAWMAHKWGDSTVVTAAGLALISAGIWTGGWVTPRPGFAKRPEDK